MKSDGLEGDKQRSQVRLNDSDDIIRLRKAQRCLKSSPGP